ncbi:hypothetical protein SKTS_09020 [Sulfurimicrobium lacus]|uniref:Antitoxin n=1 Tax=Sulfurimicrobium lacus TaxID=2715678 RepID=A0A6F8VAI7_9PROT|nr:hypothetical protein [Sulfurimicrobium lacus]BCB26016.1 hypothetical protein SKTS_09020 [Sulfurimicrobium lacus]
MKLIQTNQARKHPAKLKLDESLATQAKVMANDLSTSEASCAAATEAWDDFNERTGSFADEHSTL